MQYATLAQSQRAAARAAMRQECLCSGETWRRQHQQSVGRARSLRHYGKPAQAAVWLGYAANARAQLTYVRRGCPDHR